MPYTYFCSILVVLCVAINPIIAQTDCEFNHVIDIVLSQDAILSWLPLPWGSCTIEHYLIFITGEDEEEKVYINDEPRFNVSFLPICEYTKFVITPVSPSGIEGRSVATFYNIPVPPDVNLTITTIYIHNSFGGVMLSWFVEAEFTKCAKSFRVLIYDEDRETPEDLYVLWNYAVFNNLIPCASYQFGVRALYNLEEEGPVSPLIRYTAARQSIPTPTLKNVTLGTTSVDLVWQIESVSENRCPVSSVTLDASPYFRIAFPVRDQNSRTNFLTSLADLQPDTMYVMNVTATNTAGTTLPISFGVQTLEDI